MKKFQLIKNFGGYKAKKDKTKLSAKYLVDGSQNVISTDGDNIAVRNGYTLDGAADTTLEPIESAFTWLTHSGLEIPLRGRTDGTDDGVISYRYSGTWYELETGYDSGDFDFTTYWDTTEKQDALLFVVGDANIYYWSGGLTTFASATSNTITKQGTTSWAEERFLSAGTRQVEIEGTTYTYTGGESTTALTGVTPDPTTAGHTVGAVVHQIVRIQANTPAADYDNDIISILKNQVYVADEQRRDVYISKVGDYTSFTAPTVPRIVGEAGLLTLDETPTAMVAQEEDMYISTKNQWYKTNFTLSDALTTESLTIKLLKTSPLQGAVNKRAVFKAKNDVLFISNESILESLGRVENISTPESVDLSDSIKTKMESLTLTNCTGTYYKNNLYFAFPVDSTVMIFNIEKGFWEAPQILPVRVFSIFGENLYGHSNGVNETYQLFVEDEYSDNDNPIDARAVFAYRNYGDRAWKKNFNEWYTEGYITTNTILKVNHNYEFDGYKTKKEYNIDGSDTEGDIILKIGKDISLGKNSLGKEPLGSTTSTINDLNKFRIINKIVKEDFYEHQVSYSSNDVDQRWEILAFGGNVLNSTNNNSRIIKNNSQ